MHDVKVLKNGLRLITVPTRGTETATILVMIGTGSKYENRKNNGISHFLEHMFFKGTKKRPNCLAITAELDGMGAEFNAFTGKEYTGYWVKSDAKKINLAMDIVSDMLLYAKIDAREIEREKGVIVEELNMYLDNPMYHIEDVFEQCLYDDTPAGWDTIGTRENILNFKRSDFLEYINSQYNPNNTTVCLVGNIKNSHIEMVKKYFSNQDFAKRGKNFQEKEMVQEQQTKPKSIIKFKKTDQAHLSLGVRTYDYSNEEKTIVKMIGIILGGSMSSRLFINLRERNGLAYYVRANSEVYSDCGYLTTQAGVPVDKIDKAIKIILSEYRRLKTELVDAKELQRTKDLLNGRTAIQMEATDNLANFYSRQAVMTDTVKRMKEEKPFGDKKDLVSPKEYLGEIDHIQAGDIKRVAKKIFQNAGLNLAIIGPYKDKNKFSSLLKF